MSKIIVIDDQEDILNLVKYCLKDDYEVLTALDGESGLDLIRKEIPDLVLLDMNMPIMSGYDVINMLRSEKIIKHIIVVAITANMTEVRKNETEGSTCDYYVSKPFDPEKLEKMVKKILWDAKYRK